MKIRIILLAAMLCAGAEAFAQNSEPEATAGNISNLSWLLGTWKGQLGTKTYIERWHAAADGTIRGIGHYVANHDSSLAEVLLIQPIGDKFVYIAYPIGQSPTMFIFTEISNGHFQVRNPEHDFPTDIGYKTAGPDAIEATVSGMQKGKIRKFNVSFRRVPD